MSQVVTRGIARHDALARRRGNLCDGALATVSGGEDPSHARLHRSGGDVDVASLVLVDGSREERRVRDESDEDECPVRLDLFVRTGLVVSYEQPAETSIRVGQELLARLIQ